MQAVSAPIDIPEKPKAKRATDHFKIQNARAKAIRVADPSLTPQQAMKIACAEIREAKIKAGIPVKPQRPKKTKSK